MDTKKLRELAEAATPDGEYGPYTNRHMQVSVPLEEFIALLDENDSLRAQIASLEFQLAEEQRLGVSRLQAQIDGNRDRDKLRAEIRGLQKALKDASNDRDRCLAALLERSIGKDGGNG